MRTPYLSRKDPERDRAARLRAPRHRRFIAAVENPPVREPDEQGLSLSPAADARGIPDSLTLLPRKTVKEEVCHDPMPAGPAASTPEIGSSRLARELRRRLRAKTLENKILREALEAARETREHSAHRPRR